MNTGQLIICHVAITLTFVCPSKLLGQKDFHQDRQKSFWCPRWDNLSGSLQHIILSVKAAAHWTTAESFNDNCAFTHKWKNRWLKSVESCFRALLTSRVCLFLFLLLPCIVLSVVTKQREIRHLSPPQHLGVERLHSTGGPCSEPTVFCRAAAGRGEADSASVTTMLGAHKQSEFKGSELLTWRRRPHYHHHLIAAAYLNPVYTFVY